MPCAKGDGCSEPAIFTKKTNNMRDAKSALIWDYVPLAERFAEAAKAIYEEQAATSDPAWDNLPEERRAALVQAVKERWQDERCRPPTDVQKRLFES